MGQPRIRRVSMSNPISAPRHAGPDGHGIPNFDDRFMSMQRHDRTVPRQHASRGEIRRSWHSA